MRLLPIASMASLALVAACGHDHVNPPLPSDMAANAPDFSRPADAAVPPDASQLPDLAVAADLAVAPDLSAPPGANCGGFAGLPCAGGQFCDYPSYCGDGDESGTCVGRPRICPDIYQPVCGCDNKEYGNDCERQAAGMSLRDKGVCGCKERCGQGHYCALCRGGPACLPDGAVC